MTTERVLLACDVNGRAELTAAGVAVMVGISADEVRAKWDPAVGPASLPTEWHQAGRRRSAEARAAGGDDSAVTGLEYWANRDLGADVVIDEAARQVWMVSNEDPKPR